MKASPHPPHPQQAPPIKLQAAAIAAKQMATIPIVRAVLSFFELRLDESIALVSLEYPEYNEYHAKVSGHTPQGVVRTTTYRHI
jgi:hypothetical protein